MTDEPFETYRMADGTEIAGEYSFVTDLEWFDDEPDPIRLVHQRYREIESRAFWLVPSIRLQTCAGDDCDEDAAEWDAGTDDTPPRPWCAKHLPTEEAT